MRPLFRFGLTDEHIEQLSNGESVEFIIPDLTTPGYNEKIIIEPAEEGEYNRYTNPTYL
jgi:hypothetical protein